MTGDVEMRLLDKALLTYTETALVLGVSKSFVQHTLIPAKKLTVVELGPQTMRIPVSSIHAYLDALLEEAKAKADEPAA